MSIEVSSHRLWVGDFFGVYVDVLDLSLYASIINT